MKEIKGIDLLSHIEQFEDLKQSGKEWIGSHHTHESQGGKCLNVNPEKGFHCWNCGAKGGVIEYEMDRLSTSYEDAVHHLKEKYGIEMSDKDIESLKSLHEIQNLITKIFEWYNSKVSLKGAGDYLLKRGFSEETIKSNLIGYAPSKENKQHRLMEVIGDEPTNNLLSTGLFYKGKDGQVVPHYRDRIVFPFFHLGRIVYSIGRATEDNKENKYFKHRLHNPDDPKREYISKDAIQHIIWNEDKIGRRYEKILVAEGITDAILLQQEMPDETIISATTTSFSDKHFEALATKTAKSREINFIADSESGNIGENGALGTAKKLESLWIKRFKENPDAFNWIPGKKPGEKILIPPILKLTRLRRPPSEGKIDVADYIQQGKIDELRYWIDAARPIEHEKHRRENEPIRFFSGLRNAFLPKLVADEIMLERNYFLNSGDILHTYRDGYYQPEEGFIPQCVNRLMGELWQPSHSTSVHIKLMETHRYKDEEVNAKPDVLNLRNGLYNVNNKTLKPHTPDYLSNIRINVKKGCHTEKDTEDIVTFLNEILPPDSVQSIHEMSGYCLFGDNRYEKSFLLIGQGGNGKSTLLSLIETMLGSENISNASLLSISEDKFSVAELYGKLANFNDDIAASNIKDSSAFKILTSGKPIQAQHKYRDPFTFSNKAKMVFCSNAIPKSTDKEDGFFRRWVFIDMGKKIPPDKVNPDLLETLTTDGCLSAFFELSISGLEDLLKTKRFSESETSKSLMESHRRDNDSALAFIKENLTYSENGEVTVSEIRQAYEDYCESNRFKPQNAVNLKRRIESQFPEAQQKRHSQGKVWTGIEFYEGGNE